VSLRLLGSHWDRFVLRSADVEARYLTPHVDEPPYVEALSRVVRDSKADALIPNADPEVAVVSRHRDHLPCRVWLPDDDVVRLCQDKHDLAQHLRSHGVPAPTTVALTSVDDVAAAWKRLGAPARAWCRIRKGTGSRGATSVRDAAQARSWIEYWHTMRGVSPALFTLSEYLPGRDYSCESLWQDGRLVVVKTTQRISYFGGGDRPSGVSSNAALAKTLRDDRLVDVVHAAVLALSPTASGVFSLDIKEDAAGHPCVTEINVGRVFSTTLLFDLVGKYNVALLYARLALGESPGVWDEYDVEPDYYFVRELDRAPTILHADDLLDGVRDARTPVCRA
jgi:carbamoyl-phosphate synthase large subunit